MKFSNLLLIELRHRRFAKVSQQLKHTDHLRFWILEDLLQDLVFEDRFQDPAIAKHKKYHLHLYQLPNLVKVDCKSRCRQLCILLFREPSFVTTAHKTHRILTAVLRH